MLVIAIILLALFVIGCAGGVIFWLIAMYHFTAMTAHKRAESQHKWWSAGFMTVHIPSVLTDVGQMHRQRGFVFLARFLVCLGIAAGAALAIQAIGPKPSQIELSTDTKR
jgi:hypothetical protein